MEFARSLFEEVEGYEQAICVNLKKKRRCGGQLGRINIDFKIRRLLEECKTTMTRLSDDNNGLLVEKLKSEKERIESIGMNGFYEEKGKLSEYYAKFPEARSQVDVVESCLSKADQAPTWRGEERFGKYLDLNGLYNVYLNLKNFGNERLSYLDYLSNLGNFSSLDIGKVKNQKGYLEYLKELYDYLVSFHSRVMPLAEIDMVKMEEQFEANWDNGKIAGWERTTSKSDIENTVKQEPEKIKHELLVRGAKCGGTPQDRWNRLLLLVDSENHGETLSKKQLKKVGLFNAKQVAHWESKVQHMVERLVDYVDATKSFVTRKQSRTLEEIQQEEEEEIKRAANEKAIDENEDLYNVDEEEDNLVKSNPWNVPLDYDGKPIPLWLYKLHGLGVEYKCEICGNYSYAGRHAFERHFQDWRHQHGMKVLGIPNTEHFHHIVSIDEAKALYQKLISTIKSDTFDSNDHEEYEDSQGNVLSKKTYLDLQKQGLL